jgi:hypothetical protein
MPARQAGRRRAPALVAIAIALLATFSFVGAVGITLNDTRAVVVGWLGFAVALLVASVTPPVRRSRGGGSRSTEGAE